MSDHTLPGTIELIGGPADGALVAAPEGWPRLPHAAIQWRGATLFYAPELKSRRTATFLKQEGEFTEEEGARK